MMRNKQKMFLDFDGCIVNSIKAYCNTYNFMFKNHPDFKPANWEKVNTYNLKCQCPLVKNVETIFSDIYFFWSLEFYEKDTYDIIKKLSKKYKIIICSIGKYENIRLKAMWIEKNLPFIKDYIFLSGKDKSNINMKESIFIDDLSANLKNSNAKIKVLFGPKYSWNEDWDGVHCLTWNDIKTMFL